jgi:hypothetical protein
MASDADVVFHRQDETSQRARVASLTLAVEVPGMIEGTIAVDGRKRVDLVVALVDPVQKRRDQCFATGLSGVKGAAGVGKRRVIHAWEKLCADRRRGAM